jgi:hypothetical protein
MRSRGQHPLSRHSRPRSRLPWYETISETGRLFAVKALRRDRQFQRMRDPSVQRAASLLPAAAAGLAGVIAASAAAGWDALVRSGDSELRDLLGPLGSDQHLRLPKCCGSRHNRYRDGRPPLVERSGRSPGNRPRRSDHRILGLGQPRNPVTRTTRHRGRGRRIADPLDRRRRGTALAVEEAH